MTLKEKINQDYISAFKNRETERKNLLGVIKGEIQNEESRGTESTDEMVLSILKKMEKSLKQTNTEDSLRELSYIEGYLPKMMGEDQIKTIVIGYIERGLTNVGQIMGEFNKNYKGQADNKVVSRIVNESLTQNV